MAAWIGWTTFAELRAARDKLDEASLAVLANDTDTAATLLDAASDDIASARSSASSLPGRFLSSIPVVGSPIKAAQTTSDAGDLVVEGTRVLIRAAEALPTEGVAAVDGSDLSDLYDASTEAAALVAEARVSFEEARAGMAGPSDAWLGLVSGPSREVRSTIDDGLLRLDNAQRALELGARLTSPEADERILVLAMNSQEQRPIGGFIGSYGVLRFEDGHVELEEFASVEALHAADPPMPVPEYLSVAIANSTYGLENTGWFPEFTRVGPEAREMFQRQGGGDVTGVIAVSEDLLGDLLEVFGTIQVPGYDEPVDAESFETRVVYETEIKEPLDNPRKKFLIELSEIVFNRLLSLPADDVPDAGRAFADAVGRGELLVWFADPSVQALVEGTLAAGEFPDVSHDFLAITEANLSRSKANRQLVRTVDYQVDHDRGRDLRAHLSIVYENQGEAHPLINPYYNAFVRVYVPPGAELVQGDDDAEPVLDDAVDSGDAGPSDEVVPDAGSWFDEGIDPLTGYRSFTRSLIVFPKEARSVELVYDLPDDVAPGGHYELTYLRQAGTPNDLITLHVGGVDHGVPRQRVYEVSADLRGNAMAAWVHDRWVVRKVFG